MFLKFTIPFILCITSIVFADDSVQRIKSVAISDIKEQDLKLSQAKSWDLTMEEWDRYELIMKGPRGIWSPNLDPLTVLGIKAKDTREREYFAEKLTRVERARVDRELKFEMAYQRAQKRLFGHVPLYRIKETKPQTTGYSEVKQIGSVDLFLKLPCPECKPLVKEWMKAKVMLNVYFIGAGQKEIRAWAISNGITPAMVRKKVVTLNHGDTIAKEAGIKKFPYKIEHIK